MASYGEINLRPLSILALRSDVKQNAHFTSDNEILYPAGSAVVLHDIVLREQRFMNLESRSSALEEIILSPSRKYFAMIINDARVKGQILIIEVATMKKRRTLNFPHEATTKRFESACFSYDEKLLFAITGAPDWMMFVFNWEKGKVDTSTRANYIHNPAGSVEQVMASPTDTAICFLTGPGLFRLMSMQESVWRQYGFQKTESLHISCGAFLGSERIVLGTSDGRLLIVDCGELRAIYEAVTVNIIAIPERDETGGTVQVPPILKPSRVDNRVRGLLAFSRGFVYSCLEGQVHFFEKQDREYVRRNLFVIREKSGRQADHLDIVNHLSLSPSQDALLATTNRNQIYAVRLWGSDIQTCPEIEFQHVGESLHDGSVSGASMCTWKPIAITSGHSDRSLRIWNYETNRLEMKKHYGEDIYYVALHPTGLFAAVAFTDKLRYTSVYVDDVKECRSFNIPECHLVVFSNNGHYFAAVNRIVVQIYSTISFQLIWTFRGHSSHIQDIVWTLDDLKLVSCGIEGAVYVWDVVTGSRIGETVLKRVSFRGCAPHPDGRMVYAVGSDGKLTEICDSQVLRTFPMEASDLIHIIISQSGQIMLISTDYGAIIIVKLPILDHIEYNKFSYHNCKIVQMVLSKDDRTLLSISEDGAMVIWQLVGGEGRLIEIPKEFAYSEDILVHKDDLEAKLALIQEQSARMQELILEQDCQQRHIAAEHSGEVSQLRSELSAEISELNNEVKRLEEKRQRQLAELEKRDAEKLEAKEVEINKLEEMLNAKLVFEYEKYSCLQKDMKNQEKLLQEEINKIKESKETDLKKQNEKFEETIEMLKIEMAKLQGEIETMKNEHEEIKRRIEEDADREIIELQAKHEIQLKEEQHLNLVLKSDAGVLKKRLETAQLDLGDATRQSLRLENECRALQSTISGLETDITELKREISDRDQALQNKEKQIAEMKRQVDELEKHKFVLSYKINELVEQLGPKDTEIAGHQQQIKEMEEDMLSLELAQENLKVRIAEYKEKCSAFEKELKKLRNKYEATVNMFQMLRGAIYQTLQLMNDPKRLRNAIRNIYENYCKDKDVVKQVEEQRALEEELTRQRNHLERTVTLLREQLTAARRRPSDSVRLISENVLLIEELNALRKELKYTK